MIDRLSCSNNKKESQNIYSPEHDPILGNKFQDIDDITEYLDDGWRSSVNDEDCKNIAQNYNNTVMIKELCNHPEMMTQKGLYENINDRFGYTGTYGYCGTHYPTYLTLDLGQPTDIGLIMFLLWDNINDYNHGDVERKYYFRLLVAESTSKDKDNDNDINKDNIRWRVLYDSGLEGYRNWQIFRITGEKGIRTRYIRIHGIYNPKNNGFHVVRIRVYKPVIAQYLNTEKLKKALHEICSYDRKSGRNKFVIVEGEKETYQTAIDPNGLSQIIDIDPNKIKDIEIGDGTPLSKRIYDVSNVMHRINTGDIFTSFDIDKSDLDGINQLIRRTLKESDNNKKRYNIRTKSDIEDIIRSIAGDIEVIEKNSDGIERIIINPVNLNLRNSERFSIGITILSLVITVIPIFQLWKIKPIIACIIGGIIILIIFWSLILFIRNKNKLSSSNKRCQKNKDLNITVCDRLCKEKDRKNCKYINNNLALNKKVLEIPCPYSEQKVNINMIEPTIICNNNNCRSCINPFQLTDGNTGCYGTKGYSEFSGFCGIIYPGYITVDLGEVKEISTIQFLLWDNRGNDKKESSRDRYYYRLLYAKGSENASDEDLREWTVVYDMIRSCESGWHVYHFKKPVQMRYIRIHAIATTSTGWHIFRVVQLEAYKYPLIGYSYNYLPSFVWTINNDNVVTSKKHIGNYYKLTRFFDVIIRKIDERIKYDREDEMCSTRLKILEEELLQIRKELVLYESNINFRIGNLLDRTNYYMKNSNIIVYVSLILTMISLLFLFL